MLIVMMHNVRLTFISDVFFSNFIREITTAVLSILDIRLCNLFASNSDSYLLKLYKSALRFHPKPTGKPRQGLEDFADL